MCCELHSRELCEVSWRQGHKKLVTAPCLANRFGGPMAFTLLGTSSFDFKHFHARSSLYRAATKDFSSVFSISFLQGTPCTLC